MKNVAILIVALAACVLSVETAEAAVKNPKAKAIALDMERRAENTLMEIRTGKIKAQVPASLISEIRTFGAQSGQFAEMLDEKKMTVARAEVMAEEILRIAVRMENMVDVNGLVEMKQTMDVWVDISRRLVMTMKQMP